MPNNLIKKIHQQTKISTPRIEKMWKKDVQEARKEKSTNIYPYAVSILEKETHYKPKGEK